MRDPLPEPQRWRDDCEQANVAERAAGEALRCLPAPEPLTAVQLARIASRIRASQPKPLRRLVLVLASLLLGVATAASAAHLDILPTWITGKGPAADTSVPRPAKVPAARKGHRAAAVDVPSNDDPAPSPEPVPPLAAAPTLAAESRASVTGSAPAPAVLPPIARRVPAPTPAGNAASTAGAAAGKPALPSFPSEPIPAFPMLPPAAEDKPVPVAAAPALVSAPPAPIPAVTAAPAAAAPVAAEPERGSGAAKSLSEIVRVLRVEHDAKAALALLDRHAAEMTRNALGHEALILRVETLLELGRDPEVLRLLDGTALVDVAASHSLLVTRGRLRAAAKRCADGVGDFSLVLAESRQPDRQALFGRALCRKQLGDRAGARADLERYRRELPTDPRLGELERLLGTP